MLFISSGEDRMTFHVFLSLLLCFLLVARLWLCRLYVFHGGLAHWRAEAVHPVVHRLRHRPVPHTSVRPVAIAPSSQRVLVHRRCLCGPGARSQAGEELPNAETRKATPVPTSSAHTLASPMLTSTLCSEMASMAMPSKSRRLEALPAVPRSHPGATLPSTV